MFEFNMNNTTLKETRYSGRQTSEKDQGMMRTDEANTQQCDPPQ